MTRLWLVSPLGILFAWSGAWTCASYTQADGGVSPFNQNPQAGGSGTQGTEYSGVVVVYSPDAGGQHGLMAGPDGGVTVGPAASFSSNFVYMSNSADGTISRILVPSVGAPFEQARYNCLMPMDNHKVNQGGIWQQAGWNQLMGGGINSPSRTLVDRSGNVWVALRAPGYQAGITEIANVSDNLAQCTPRCVQRHLLQPNQSFTEGVPLNLAAGGTVTLGPPELIAPNTNYARTYYCEDTGHDHTGNTVTDEVNYDDCILMSIPLGDPTPDPLADPMGLTRGTSFGRAAAMSPNCNPSTAQCDVYLGMWNGTSLIHLGYSSPYANGAPYDVVKRLNTGVNPYGETVDCAGIVWSGAVADGALAAITTIPLNDPATGLNIPADTILTANGGIPNSSSCGQYGIASDVKERIWIASYGGVASSICSFNAGALLADYAGFAAGTITPTQFNLDMKAAWSTYDVSAQYAGGNGRGINTDKSNNVFMAFDSGSSRATAINPDIVGPLACLGGGTCGAVPCHTPNGGGAACPNGSYLWPNMASGTGSNSIGIDLDENDNVWIGNYSSGSASEFNGVTGAFMNSVGIGAGVYSYSDFTGYALRNITLSSGLLSQVFNGCGTSPEFTQWQTLTYNATTPTGTDVEIEVQPTNSLDPVTLANLTPTTVCQSVVNGNCSGTPQVCTPCGNPINLEQYNLPGSEYLVVNVLLFPKICSQNGGATATDKPVLYGLDVTEFCPGN